VFGAVAGDGTEHSRFLAKPSGELLNAVIFLLSGRWDTLDWHRAVSLLHQASSAGLGRSRQQRADKSGA
jgi:hypothetical protein